MLARAYALWGMDSQVDRILAEVMPQPDITIDVVLFNAILEAYQLRGGDTYIRVRNLLNIMKSADIEPDRYTYSTILKILARYPSKVAEIYPLLRDSKLVDRHMYTTLMRCAVEAGDLNQLLKYYEDMTKSTITLDKPIYILLIQAIETFITKNDNRSDHRDYLEFAEKIAQEMMTNLKLKDPPYQVLLSLCRTYAVAKNEKRVSLIFKELRNQKIRPDKETIVMLNKYFGRTKVDFWLAYK